MIIDYYKMLPYFQDKYSFERCGKDDIEPLRLFIDRHYKKNHIFVLSKELFDWQFFDIESQTYNIIIAKRLIDNCICAMLGFVTTAHFDHYIKTPVRWGNMWKSLEDTDPGVGLMVEWKKNMMTSAIADVGLGESALAIRLARKLGAKTGIMQHYFIINPNKDSFKIAKNNSARGWISDAPIKNKRFREITVKQYELLPTNIFSYIPCFKSKTYYINRYFYHPVYSYRATMILDENNSVIGVFFWRLIEVMEARCIRIIDYFGTENALVGCRRCFETLLDENDAEYLDFLCVGMNQEELEAGGFIERHIESEWVIPNYFEPFTPNNVDITYSFMAYDCKVPCIIFKGDSDQDRPNIIKE